MKIFELFSGFIAAIVIALGAGLYVNQDASVGEELVVEEVKPTESNRQDVWYLYVGEDKNVDPAQYLLDIIDPTKYMNTEEQTFDGCDESDQICAIRLPDSGLDHPEETDFEELQPEIEQESDASGDVKLKS